MKVAGEYMGNKGEMLLEVVEKGQNRRFDTKQTESPFQKWESTREFQGNGDKSTRVTHAINYELPAMGKIANFLSGSRAEGKIRQGIRQSDQAVKQNLE